MVCYLKALKYVNVAVKDALVLYTNRQGVDALAAGTQSHGMLSLYIHDLQSLLCIQLH